MERRFGEDEIIVSKINPRNIHKAADAAMTVSESIQSVTRATRETSEAAGQMAAAAAETLQCAAR